MSDDTKVLEGLRSDVRALGARQAQDTNVLHGRFGALEKSHKALASEVGEMRPELAVIGENVDKLVKHHEQQQTQELHLERVEAEAEADKSVAIVKSRNERLGTVGKIVIGIIGLIAAALGGNAAGGM